VHGLKKIFLPIIINAILETEVKAIASWPSFAKCQREFLEDRIKKLQDGHEISKGVMGSDWK
jgi:hypothetical protein